MKTICFIAGGLFSCLLGTAQIVSPKPNNDLKQGNPVVDWATNISGPKAKLIGQSPLGKIYALPQDNMPCLVPATPVENAMPVLVPPAANLFMPNAITRQNVIPSALSKYHIFKLKKAPLPTSDNLMLDLVRKK